MTESQPRRRRATRADIAQHGKNIRRVWKDLVSAQQRLDYLCGTLFANDVAKMAFVLGVCKRYLNDIARGHSRLTMRLAAHIVTRLGVRAEWLLCGSGDVFIDGAGTEPYFSAWPEINSLYHTADSIDVGSGVLKNWSPVVVDMPAELFDSAAVSAAALKIFSAAKLGYPVVLWLAETSWALDAPETWLQFFTEKYASALLLPLSTASVAAPDVNMNVIAVRAAATVTGLGETLCRFVSKTNPLARIYAAGATVVCAAQVGETAAHLAPTPRPLELGAAIGAAAYIDWLALTAHLDNFFVPPGGALVVCDGVDRVLPLLQTQCLARPLPAHFSLIVLGPLSDTTRVALTALGADIVWIAAPAAKTAAALLAACHSAYVGTYVGT